MKHIHQEFWASYQLQLHLLSQDRCLNVTRLSKSRDLAAGVTKILLRTARSAWMDERMNEWCGYGFSNRIQNLVKASNVAANILEHRILRDNRLTLKTTLLFWQL